MSDPIEQIAVDLSARDANSREILDALRAAQASWRAETEARIAEWIFRQIIQAEEARAADAVDLGIAAFCNAYAPRFGPKLRAETEEGR